MPRRVHNSILVLVALKGNKACGPRLGTPAASGFTCPLCLWEKISSAWTKPKESGEGAGQQCKIPAQSSFSKALFNQVLMFHQNLAEVPDKLNACKPMGCGPAFVTICGGGDPTDFISGYAFLSFSCFTLQLMW